MKRAALLRIGALALLGATPAFGQEPPAPSAPPAAAAPATRTVVVIADPFPDETDNAKLRARVYSATRDDGLAPDTKTDVAAAARDSGAVKDGRVSADATALESLRRLIHAEVVIRITKDPRGVSVLLVRQGAEPKSSLVASADEVPNAVHDLLAGASAPTASATALPPAGGPLSAGYIADRPKHEEERDLTDPKTLAKAWKDRGGLRISYGVSAMATGLIIPDTQYAGQNPETGQTEIGKKNTYGVGGGLGAHFSLMYLPLPQPTSGATSWAAFRVGTAFMLHGLYVRPPKELTYQTQGGAVVSRDTKYANDAYLYGVLPIQLGVHFGFGDFRLPTLWRGFALGLAYSPAWIFSLSLSQSNGKVESQFNYAGFEVSLDVVKLEAGHDSGPQPRLFALVLPRVKNDLPWFASAGIGAIWY